MKNLYRIVSGITFASFCSKIAIVDGSTIDFQLKKSFHGNEVEEEFRLRNTGKRLVLSDKGTTRANLDRVPRLKDSEVVGFYIEQFGMEEKDKVISYTLSPSQDIIQQIWHYLQRINVLYMLWPIFENCINS